MRKYRRSAAFTGEAAQRSEVRDNPETRIGEMITPAANGCWDFTGTKNRGGYGVVWDGFDEVLAHRFVYETLVGPIPSSHDLHHECMVRHCVNPEHLTPLTRSDHSREHNRLRAAAKAA